MRSFQSSNGPAVAADAQLAVEHRPAALQPDRQRSQRKQRRGDREQQRRQHHVKNAGQRRLPFRRHRMRILYLHQFFITRAGVGGTRSYEFARRFVERGHGVRMVTAGDGTRTVDGIEVVGVRGAYSDYMRATGHLEPAPHARLRPLRARRDRSPRCAGRGPDVIYATSPPLTMALPGAGRGARAGARRSCSRCATCGRRRRSRWARCATRWRSGSARALERFVYARSARLIALSPGIRAGVLAAGGQEPSWCRTPSDLDLFDPSPPGRQPFLVSATSAPWARPTT